MHKPGFLRGGNHRTRDDGREEEHGGAVRQYLEQTKQAGDTVSMIELWHQALNYAPDKKPARRDSMAINRIMNSQPGWVRCPSPVSTPWGPQRGFLKSSPPPERIK